MADFEIGSPFHQYLETKFTALEERLDAHTTRISALESWRSWIMGGLAVVGAIATGMFGVLGTGLKWLFLIPGPK